MKAKKPLPTGTFSFLYLSLVSYVYLFLVPVELLVLFHILFPGSTAASGFSFLSFHVAAVNNRIVGARPKDEAN